MRRSEEAIPMTVEKATALFGELIDTVLSHTPVPEDGHEVAALLEAAGWTDHRAQEAFGVRDVFELAAEVWQACRTKIVIAPIAIAEETPFYRRLWQATQAFLRGTIFALPMAMSIFAMLAIRYSLWSYMYFDVETATSIAAGTVLSFMVTGGFTQATARRGFLYLGQNEYRLARNISFFFIRLGLLLSLLVGLLLIVVNLIFQVFTWKMIGICLLYYSFLCLIWLSVTVLYMLRKEIIFAALMALGIGIVYLLNKLYELIVFLKAPEKLSGIEVFRHAYETAVEAGALAAVKSLLLDKGFWAFHEAAGMNIIFFQAVALTMVSLGSLAIAGWIFHQAGRRAESGRASLMPRLSIVVYTSIPYFVYGFLYFTFLFIDRINAWSANSLYMPYLFWFRGEYELGLDWALLTLIIPLGVVEMTINQFADRLVGHQKTYTVQQAPFFNKHYLLFYRRHLIYYLVIAVGSGLLVYLGMIKLQSLHLLDVSLFLNDTTYLVFSWAVVGYVITAAGLLNALFLFSLSRPELAVRGIGIGCATNLLAGFLLSRWVNYSWAVFGLVAGALLFAVVTTISLVRVLKTLDYNLYAAA
jgi:hypothetical protein